MVVEIGDSKRNFRIMSRHKAGLIIPHPEEQKWNNVWKIFRFPNLTLPTHRTSGSEKPCRKLKLSNCYSSYSCLWLMASGTSPIIADEIRRLRAPASFLTPVLDD